MALVVELLSAEAAQTEAKGSRAAARHDLAVAAASLEFASGLEPTAGTEPDETSGGASRASRP